MYSLLRGPFLWVAFAVFFLGLGYKAVTLYSLSRKKDKVFYNHLNVGYALTSIVCWLMPFGTRPLREHPWSALFMYVFHLCLIVTPLFLLGHAVEFFNSWGVMTPALPDSVTDLMTWILLGSALALVARRMFLPEARILTEAKDYLLLLAVAAPFATGLIAYHQWLDAELAMILHILSAGLMLILVPFTKLSHALLFFFTRAFIGSEFARRKARTW